MTVITYSNGVGKLQNKVPEHPSSWQHVPRGSGMLSPEVPQCCGGRRCAETKKEGRSMQNVKGRWQKSSKGVNFPKDLKGGGVKRESMNEMEVSRMFLKSEERRMRGRKLWDTSPVLPPLRNMTESNTGMQICFVGLNWHQVLVWWCLLFLSLCTPLASSQVRATFRNNVSSVKEWYYIYPNS